jgi:hypothetical protein
MDEIIVYCGLVCQGCPIYWATRESNDEKRRKMRAEIALQIRKQGWGEYKPQDITDCDGCKTKNGRLFSSCMKCEIRKCARQKGIENCAHCNEYACERLDRFFTTCPEAKSRLDAIRSVL